MSNFEDLILLRIYILTYLTNKNRFVCLGLAVEACNYCDTGMHTNLDVDVNANHVDNLLCYEVWAKFLVFKVSYLTNECGSI